MEYAPTWFYFYNGKLVQYGLPNDWPKDPVQDPVEVRVDPPWFSRTGSGRTLGRKRNSIRIFGAVLKLHTSVKGTA
jgi:hypothetical protein